MTNRIPISASPHQDQAWSALRSAFMAVGAWAIGRGYLQADTATAIGAVGLVVVPFIIGQLKTRRRAQEVNAVTNGLNNTLDIIDRQAAKEGATP